MGRPPKSTGRPSFIPCDLTVVSDYSEPLKPVHLTLENLKAMSSEELSLHIETILKRYAEGEYLKTIFPDYAINRWRWREILSKNPQLYKRFNDARECHIECILERMHEIAEDSSQDTLVNKHGVKYLNKEFVARSKLQVELFQWMVEKLEKRKLCPPLGDNSPISHKAQSLTAAMFDGQLHPTQCVEILRALNQEADILKTHELEKRLETIEKNIPNK